MGRDSSLVCHCHSQTHSHKPASQHSSGLSLIHTGLSAPNSSLFAPKMLPSKRASSRSGTSCSSRFLDSRRLPLWGKSSLNYRILNNCPHHPPGCSVARCVVTNTTPTWQLEVCAASARLNTTHFGGFSLNGINYKFSEILSRYKRSYTTNPARVEARNA